VTKALTYASILLKSGYAQQTSKIMKQFICSAGVLVVGAFSVLGCSGGDNSEPDAGLKGYGETCSTDAECDSAPCVEGYCSKTCKSQRDCPLIRGKAFDCGEIKDGLVGCYPRTYKAQQYGMGYDCSIDGKCGVGYRCMGNTGDAERYCSNKCESDMDCPPEYWCSQVRVGADVEPEKWCRRRQFCHPCVIDDQCAGEDNLCVKDKNGKGYCSKACTKAGTTCPSWAKCEDAGNNTLQCRPVAGTCAKPDGDLCDPCVIHGWTTKASAGAGCNDTNDCREHQYCAALSATTKICLPVSYTIAEEATCKKDARCMLLDRYSGESGCITPCTADTDCPSATAYACVTITSLGAKYCVPVDADGYIGSCVP